MDFSINISKKFSSNSEFHRFHGPSIENFNSSCWFWWHWFWASWCACLDTSPKVSSKSFGNASIDACSVTSPFLGPFGIKVHKISSYNSDVSLLGLSSFCKSLSDTLGEFHGCFFKFISFDSQMFGKILVFSNCRHAFA